MEKYIRESDAVQTVMEKPDMTPDEKAGIIRRLKALPAADVVEVVRCRECIYNCGETKDLWGNPAILCVTAVTHEPDWYCASGKRKAGGKDDG